MTSAIVVPDLSFIQRAGRKNGMVGAKELQGKLKYFEFRDDRDGHIPQQFGQERWRDHGLGGRYKEILAACDDLGSSRLLAWTWVISPAPDLIALLPENARRGVVEALTESVVEAYYTARNTDLPEYSYVLHDRMTHADEGNPAQQHLHTHVVLPATVPTLEGERAPFDNRANKGHLTLLHEIANAQLELLLDQQLRPEWRLLRPERYPDAESATTSSGGQIAPEIEPDQLELELPTIRRRTLSIGR